MERITDGWLAIGTSSDGSLETIGRYNFGKVRWFLRPQTLYSSLDSVPLSSLVSIPCSLFLFTSFLPTITSYSTSPIFFTNVIHPATSDSHIPSPLSLSTFPLLLDAFSCFTYRCCMTSDWKSTFVPFFNSDGKLLTSGLTRIIWTGETPETTSVLWVVCRIMQHENLNDDLTPKQRRARDKKKVVNIDMEAGLYQAIRGTAATPASSQMRMFRRKSTRAI